MINTHSLELLLSRTYFHGSIGVRAIEVLLYLVSGQCGYLSAFYFLEFNVSYQNDNVLPQPCLENKMKYKVHVSG